ncbi:MAG: tryptophan synthase subunit alpha [Bacteriovoracaceae bacterium]|nr:tryptophan synthase subunit alpha [Bacteroidota bacterium]
MNRISLKFQEYQKLKKAVIVPYISPEFPVKGSTVPLILALERSGASMIEVGIPFSDPLADGPTIQHSSEIAIKHGVTLTKVLELVKEARTHTSIPIILMGYVNPIMSYGFDRFFEAAAAAGVDGLIVPDLPPEESDDFRTQCKKHGLSTIFLIAPTSPDKRIRYIDSLSTDFSYCVSVTGVTGARTSFGGNFDDFLGRVKKNTSKPFVVGFGIKSKEQVDRIASTANGVVVGSALLQAMEGKTTVEDAAAAASKFLSSLM